MPLVPEEQLTPEEVAALLNRDPNLVMGADRPQLPVAPIPPQPEFAAPPPPDPNDPHNKYMTGRDVMEEAPAPAPPPLKAAEPPKAPPPPATPPPAPQAPQVLSTKPGWYKDEAPPEISPIPGVVGGLGLGILGALLARKNPAVAAGMGGLGALSALQTVADNPQRNFANRLDVAGKQSDMNAVARGGGASYNPLSWMKFEEQKRIQQLKETKAAQLAKIDSPETREVQDMFINQGMDEVTARSMNGAQLLQGRTGFQQQLGQERGQLNAINNHNMRTDTQFEQTQAANREYDRRQGVETQQQIGKEEREQQQLNEQATIPGYRFTGKRAPNIAAVEKARGIADQTEVAEMAAQNMVDLWKQLDDVARLTPAIFEGALPDDVRGKVNELRAWGLNLDTAQRQLALMGVPQVFEMEIMRTVSPDATGLRALLNNGQAWAAQKRVLGKLADKRMSKYGYEREVAPEETVAPSSGDKTLAGKIEDAGKATQQITGQVADAAGQVVKNAANTVGPALKKIKVFNAKTQQWIDAQKAEEEIQKTIQELKARGLDPSKFIQVVP